LKDRVSPIWVFTNTLKAIVRLIEPEEAKKGQKFCQNEDKVGPVGFIRG